MGGLTRHRNIMDHWRVRESIPSTCLGRDASLVANSYEYRECMLTMSLTVRCDTDQKVHTFYILYLLSGHANRYRSTISEYKKRYWLIYVPGPHRGGRDSKRTTRPLWVMIGLDDHMAQQDGNPRKFRLQIIPHACTVI